MDFIDRPFERTSESLGLDITLSHMYHDGDCSMPAGYFVSVNYDNLQYEQGIEGAMTIAERYAEALQSYLEQSLQVEALEQHGDFEAREIQFALSPPEGMEKLDASDEQREKWDELDRKVSDSFKKADSDAEQVVREQFIGYFRSSGEDRNREF